MKSESTHNLSFFPITLFGGIMGYLGLTLAIQNASQLFGLSPVYFQTTALLSSFLFILITSLYLIKSIKYPKAVQNELQHPIAGNFFSAFSMSLLLISLVYKEITPQAASILWYLGASLQLFLTVYMLNSWIHHEKWEITSMHPAWFLPVVGNIIAPLGAIHFADYETAWFFFSVGLVFWLILQIILLYRLFFYPPMAKPIEPFLFIFMAPPAMGFLSYVAISGGEIDGFARVLYYTAIFFALLLLSQAKRFIKVPFSLAWWAFTFPIAAMANASWIMYENLNYEIYANFALFFMLLLCLIIIKLTFQTFMLVKNKSLCVPPKQPNNQAKNPPKTPPTAQ